MRVDNRVNHPPPTRNRDNEATSRSADLGRNRTRAELPAQPTVLARTPADPHRVATATARLSLTVLLPVAVAVTLTAAAATTEAPTMEPTGGPAAAATAAVETT
jgi:hypothetical protein